MITTQLDLREMPCAGNLKILSAFDLLKDGQALEILLGMDSEPLQILFLKEKSGLFLWENLETGPPVWKIRLIRVAHGLGELSKTDKIVPDFRPAWVDSLSPSCGLFLDIRPLTLKGLDPLQTVVRSTTELKPGQYLHLLLDVPPETFIRALDRLGFEGFSEIKHGIWNAYFRRGRDIIPGPLVLELDVRGLESPLPLLKVLESLPSISEGGVMKVLYPNRPDSLAEKMGAHGFEVVWNEFEGTSYVLQVWKNKN
jgi:uncharacterized protein (DUF2249 family)